MKIYSALWGALLKVHSLLCCPGYEDIREQFIPKKYYNGSCLCKVTMLMASQSRSIILNLANYIHKAFDNRRECVLSP